MKQPLKNIYCVLLLFLLVGCKETETERLTRIVTEWQGREVIFPEETTFKNYLRDSIYNISKENKVLVYIDSFGCTSCRLRLDDWIKFANKVDSSVLNPVSFLFVVDSKDTKDFLSNVKRKKFTYPIFIDKEGVFNRNNLFPQEESLQVFLLDSLNQVKVIGNPVRNVAMTELYIKYLTP